MAPRLQWIADEQLCALIRRYYRGEAGLWEAIRARIDAELRERGIIAGAFHIRLRRIDDAYQVTIDDADGYANDVSFQR